MNLESIADCYTTIMIYKGKLDELEAERDHFNNLEKLFDMTKSKYKVLT
jgi:hypothetical protein